MLRKDGRNDAKTKYSLKTSHTYSNCLYELILSLEWQYISGFIDRDSFRFRQTSNWRVDRKIDCNLSFVVVHIFFGRDIKPANLDIIIQRGFNQILIFFYTSSDSL